jgi:uncharacterized membrane protein
VALAFTLGLLLVLIGLAGLLDAAYFVGVTYGWVASEARWVPRACRMDQDTCASIVDTSYGRALGLPNAVYGLGWYSVLAAAGTALLVLGRLPGCSLLVVVGALVVLFSVYLAWSLVQKLDVFCPLCYIAHGLNGLALVALVLVCVLVA